MIVRRGEVVNAADLEALNTFGLGEPTDQTSLIISSLAIIFVAVILVLIFYQRNRKQIFSQLNSLTLVAFSLLLFLVLAKFFIMDHTILPYLFPLAAFGLTLSIVFNPRIWHFYDHDPGRVYRPWASRGNELRFITCFQQLRMLVIGKARRIVLCNQFGHSRWFLLLL